jgi:hypothetical protein
LALAACRFSFGSAWSTQTLKISDKKQYDVGGPCKREDFQSIIVTLFPFLLTFSSSMTMQTIFSFFMATEKGTKLLP